MGNLHLEVIKMTWKETVKKSKISKLDSGALEDISMAIDDIIDDIQNKIMAKTYKEGNLEEVDGLLSEAITNLQEASDKLDEMAYD